MREADRKDFAAFLDEFQAETDRGAALVGAALLDQKLKDTLAAFFADRRVGAELLNGGNAPLGTLSARIKAALCLGLIDRHEFHECDLIRRIRNEFAHRTHGTTFSDPVIAAHCSKLRSDLPGGPSAFRDNPRDVFINATILTVMRLTYRGEYVAREKRTIKVWP
jgi:mannitol operon repressor